METVDLKKEWAELSSCLDELGRVADTPGCTPRMLRPWKKLAGAHVTLLGTRLLLLMRLGMIHPLVYSTYLGALISTIHTIQSTQCHER